jgi:predicted HicB family RNase H-like nuclease
MASFQEDFIGAVKAGGQMRKRAFDYWAERHGDKFANGEKGYKFYCDLLEEVKKAGDPKGLKNIRKDLSNCATKTWWKQKCLEHLLQQAKMLRSESIKGSVRNWRSFGG